MSISSQNNLYEKAEDLDTPPIKKQVCKVQHIEYDEKSDSTVVAGATTINNPIKSIIHQIDLPDFYNHGRLTHNTVLDVVAVISNPVRFHRRYQLFNEFVERMQQNQHVRLTTVELQFGARPYVTNATFKYRSESELWHKENLINTAIEHLPSDWEYVAWIDADVEFQNKNWAMDTIEQLQHYDVVQLFSEAIDLGPNHEILMKKKSFCYQYSLGKEFEKSNYGDDYWFTGYAWAMRRSTFNNLGGLIEFAIIGHSDYHMAMAFIGRISKSWHPKIHINYQQLCLNWQKRAEMHVRQNIGYVAGIVFHFYHGKRVDRKYYQRWAALIDNVYDPLFDIKKDWQGILCLESNKPKLRDDIRRYFRERNEDSIDL